MIMNIENKNKPTFTSPPHMMQWELYFPDTSVGVGVDVGATVMMITVSVDM